MMGVSAWFELCMCRGVEYLSQLTTAEKHIVTDTTLDENEFAILNTRLLYNDSI